MLRISIMTQKGGLGKSTFTMILANRLRYYHAEKVLVVDCNVPQISILTNRERELKLLEQIKRKKEIGDELTTKEKAWAIEFEKTAAKTGIKTFDVVPIYDKTIQKDYNKLNILAKDYDVVLYDLPGSLEDRMLLNVMLTFDYIFVPMEPDAKSGIKSLATAAGLYNLKEKFKNSPNTNLQAVYLFFNKVRNSKQHREEMSSLYLSSAKKGLEFLTQPDGTPIYVDERVMYQNDLTCSTVFNTEPLLRYTKAAKLIDSIIKTIRHE